MYVCMYVVIATSIVLAEAGFLQALYDGLELLNDVYHYYENCAALLTTRLEDMSKGQHLKLVANLSECYTDMPRNTAFTVPINWTFAVFPWQILHGPVLDNSCR